MARLQCGKNLRLKRQQAHFLRQKARVYFVLNEVLQGALPMAKCAATARHLEA